MLKRMFADWLPAKRKESMSTCLRACAHARAVVEVRFPGSEQQWLAGVLGVWRAWRDEAQVSVHRVIPVALNGEIGGNYLKGHQGSEATGRWSPNDLTKHAGKDSKMTALQPLTWLWWLLPQLLFGV